MVSIYSSLKKRGKSLGPQVGFSPQPFCYERLKNQTRVLRASILPIGP